MNNCGQQPVMVPTWVELDTRDLDVRDLTATNGSFKTLSVNGEPVLARALEKNRKTLEPGLWLVTLGAPSTVKIDGVVKQQCGCFFVNGGQIQLDPEVPLEMVRLA